MAFGLSLDNVTCPLAGDGLAQQSFKRTPRPYQVAEAPDEWGHPAARHLYGGSDTILEYEAEFYLKSGTAPTTLTIGAETMVDSLQIETSNGDWPKYTIKWRSGVANPSGLSFTLALPALKPWRCAQPLGVKVTGSGKLSSTTLSFTCDFSEIPDADGSMAAGSWSNGKAELTAEAVNVDAGAVFEVDDGWDVEEDGTGASQNNTDYETTSSFKASKALTATVPADPAPADPQA